MPGQPLDVLGHLDRAGGAVEAERRDRIAAKSRRRRGDLRAEQHGAGGLDGDRHHDRHVLRRLAAIVESLQTRVDGALDLKKVLTGLDEQRVGAAVDETTRLLGVALEHALPGDLSQREQFGAGSHRPEHEAGLVGGGVGLAGGPRDLGGLLVEVVGPGDEFLVELGEDELVGPEGVGLDGVGPGGEVALVDLLDELGAGADEDVHTVLPPEVVPVDGEGHRLESRTHRPIEKQDAAAEMVEQS